MGPCREDSPVKTDYATKINALLAKAEATTHEAERVTFTEAAERLMVKWGVSDAMLSDAERRADAKKTVPIEQRQYPVFGPNAALLAEVAAQVAKGVAPVQTLIARGKPRWWCIGHTDDLARVELYVPHIVAQATPAWRAHWKNGLAEGLYWESDYNRARVTFMSYYGWTVKGRLAAMFRDVASTPEAGALVLLKDRADAVHDRYVELYPRTKTARPRRSYDNVAANGGVRAGHAATISAGALAR